MAEIKIEKKNKKPVWPWILALLIIGAVVFWIWSDEPEPTMEDTDMTTEERIPVDEETDENEGDREGKMNTSEAVDDYVSFVQNSGGSMGKDHEYTKKGINHLAYALEAMAQQMPESPEVDKQLAQLKDQADKLTRERESTRHANMIRDAFITSANLIAEFQKMNYPEMKNEVEDLKTTAKEVKKDELTMEQSEEVIQYFNQSADIIEQMVQKIQS